MILTCPECETQYFADDATIGSAGRTVKCAACGHEWFVGPEGPREATLAGAHELYRLKVLERKRQKSRTAAMMVWLVTGALFAGLLGGFVLFRDRVVEVWPQSASTYAALGLPVNRFGLDFVAAESERFFDGTTPILEVRGAVENVQASPVAAPLVRVTLLDEQGAAVSSAFARIDAPRIAEGEQALFVTRIENPPVDSFELELSFVKPQSAAAEADRSQP
ncbi:MAG: MJ0042-type zinc finger domain-containing protein [Pseudomonadota bacterium]